MIKRVGRIGDITVCHIQTELSRFAFYLIHEGGSVTETIANITPRPSTIGQGGLEIQTLMYFVHKNNAILNKIKTFLH